MQSSTDPSSLTDLIGDLVSVNNRLTRLAAASTPAAESPAVWRTIAVLRDLGPMRLGELARVSRVSQPTMTKLVHTLDERGWIRRIADANDARAWLISADPAGLAALDAWRDELVGAMAPYFDDLSADERDALARAVAVIRTRIERADDAARNGATA
ncbi:MarR family transcriptional regulator [Agromyces endophyticus]|uniref:MarR family winged helix-turn-helix transcriptional regulator n=1 Tax=Agromyces sp. H17E-10 TaxID=2932244 RepID=UPI001FD32565|nr:MarR family transcriptional regulator [Agromyces sp. H17E-10]UOQ90344.1 MarR family transcriptional regulator [Agromyces sp. H17E-10]